MARDLLGCVLWAERDGVACAGRLVEVEAYLGPDDPASHAARGPTPRSAIMFGRPAVAYVYVIYGMHHCLNLVTEADGTAGAVLVRALEPLAGRDLMAARRLGGAGPAATATGGGPRRPADRSLAGGPGRLCQALGIDRGWNGMSLLGEPSGGRRLWLTPGAGPPPRLLALPRVGVRRAADRPWRLVDADSPCLSRPPARPRRRREAPV